KDSGFDAVDWNIDHAWERRDVLENGVHAKCVFTENMDTILDYWKEHLEAIRENGLKIAQAHAPFPAYTLSYNGRHPDFLDYAIEVYKNCIRLCHQAGCPYLVIHGISRRRGLEHPTVEEQDEVNRKLYTSLIPTLLETDVTVCLENLFTGDPHHLHVSGHCSEPQKAAAFIDELNQTAGKECFGLCLDVGHLFLLHIDFTYYITTLGTRIKALHIHDNDGAADSHLAPYAGNVPWEDFLSAMKAIGYKGILNFETFAQVLPTRIPPELVPEFLQHIAAIGRYFARRIEE
ncbi:MAG: sugar phosphate isomerase/epimerase, partial [Clostridia bacterium]|nr:sugar phosphate isomerase/epimerase [Clostridia bacterium]